MSALARYFNAMGKEVAGYDKTPTPLTHELEREKIAVHYEDEVKRLPAFILDIRNKSDVLVIFTPAIPSDHKQINFIRDNGFSIYKRSEVLGLLTAGSYTIAVAGTHGKTTTSSIIAHLLKSSGIDCTAFLGGIAVNYNSNLLLPSSGHEESRQVIVVEADEFDRSFLTLYPDLAVITSMDADHLDIYGDKEQLEESYRLFAAQVKPEGTLFYKAGLALESDKQHRMSYSVSLKSDIEGRQIEIKNHRYYFELITNGQNYPGLSLGIPGRHNVENAIAAAAVALKMGLSIDTIKAGLDSYRGVRRRFELILQTENCTFIDDYAHHPEELRAAISSVKELYPEKRITGIFQPHLYSRTRDFAAGFAESLSLLDELILLDIYPARELPVAGITSEVIFDKVTIKNKTLCVKDNLLTEMEKRSPEVLITLGAGDIDQYVYPLRDKLIKQSVAERNEKI